MKKNVITLVMLLLVMVLNGCEKDTITGTNEGTNNFQEDNQLDGEHSENVQDGTIDEVTESVVRAYKTAEASDFEYEVMENGIKITEYIGDDVIVVIPNTIEGKPVIEVNSLLFANSSRVKGVMFPENITSLVATFANNKSIQVVICEGVERILHSTFFNCPELHTLILGNNIQELGEYSISVCRKLKSVTIPATLLEIDDEFAMTIFYACDVLTVYGEAGSFIESFCVSNEIPFEVK